MPNVSRQEFWSVVSVAVAVFGLAGGIFGWIIGRQNDAMEELRKRVRHIEFTIVESKAKE